MNSDVLKFIIALIGFVLVCFGYRGLTTGVVKIKGAFNISKVEKPTVYWINVCVYLVVGAAGVLFAMIS